MTDSEEFLTALRRIAQAADLQSRRLLKQTGLTVPQLLILQILRRDGALSAGALARQMSLSQATITSILARLEGARLVRRDRGRSDRRIVYVSLTQDGDRRLLSAPELMNADFMRCFRGLADWERSMMLSTLQRVAAIMALQPHAETHMLPKDVISPMPKGDALGVENPILIPQVNME